jgi:hypothetical protein
MFSSCLIQQYVRTSHLSTITDYKVSDLLQKQEQIKELQIQAVFYLTN